MTAQQRPGGAAAQQGGGRGGSKGGNRGFKGGGRGGSRGAPAGREDGIRAAESKILAELKAIERALAKQEFADQATSLGLVLEAVRPLRLRALAAVPPDLRGKLITTLTRVVRQRRPASPTTADGASPTPVEDGGHAAPVADATTSSEDGSAESSTAADTVDSPVTDQDPPGESVLDAAGTASSTNSADVANSPPVETIPASGYSRVIDMVAQIWLALGERERSTTAYALIGGQAEAVAKAPSETGAESVTLKPADKFAPTDWRARAADAERRGRTREAGRLWEEHQEYAEAVRAFEAAGDHRSVLRCALQAGNAAALSRAARKLPAEVVERTFESAGAWDRLMQYYVDRSDFSGMAALYERARQFDQAGMAWERAGKLGHARKAFEKAGQKERAAELRTKEVTHLREAGDVLAAATVLLEAGDSAGAEALLREVPGPKGYKFLTKLNLTAAAAAVADAGVREAQAQSNHAELARWHEALGKLEDAAEAWEQAGRKDLALRCWQQSERWNRAAPLAEAVGRFDVAARLYERAGDAANAGRLRAALAAEGTPVASKPKAGAVAKAT